MITPNEHYPELGKALGVADLYLKREDLHPYGSHKGRSIPLMVDHYVEGGDRRFAISSSGNAGLAAAIHVRKLNSVKLSKDESDKKVSKGNVGEPIGLDVFVGNHVAPNKLVKLKELADDHIRVLTKERPLQALTQAVNEGVRGLRQSTDDEALVGYETLAEEISEIGNVGAVFIGTSSGTTAQALAEYFSNNKSPIQVHIVQTRSCHPMVDSFGDSGVAVSEMSDANEEKSIADAIVDVTAYRKDRLVPLIRETGGSAWVASNDDIRAAQESTLKHASLTISVNGALSVVGAMKAAEMGYDLGGTVVCVVGGE